MKFLLATALLLAANSVRAQEDPEAGLTEGHLLGDPSAQPVALKRPQLVYHDRKTPKIIGATAAIGGGVALIGAWALYVSRENYRLRYWSTLSNETIDTWSSLGAWSLWMGVGASALLVTSEYLLLPESRDVPTLAWVGGAIGVGVAAVGVGFMAGGTHCAPVAIRPGAELNLACSAGTSDAVFGPLMIASAMPLFALPMVYLTRQLFAGAPDSLSLGPGGIVISGKF